MQDVDPVKTTIPISALMLGRSKNRAGLLNLHVPPEREWAEAQPLRWRDTCLAFAIASNTRGGVVGKSLQTITREANNAGIPISVATMKRHVPVLQAYGVIYLDEKNPVYREAQQDFVQYGSTWIFNLNQVMPKGVKYNDRKRCDRPTAVEWMRQHGIVSPWNEGDPALSPHLTWPVGSCDS